MNILLADDEPLVLDILTRLLQRAGHSVHTSPDGSDAWEAFHAEAFDIVMTDLEMPGLDGLNLAMKIKHEAPLQRVVLMTGAGDDGVLPPNIDFVLGKPVCRGTLTELLDQIPA